VRRPVAALLAASALVGGCGIQPDSAPREVGQDDRARLSGVSVGGDASGAERIYLVGPGDERLLRSVPRDPSSSDQLIDVLFLGPNEDERNEQFTTNIPTSVQVLSVGAEGSKLVVDVSRDLLSVSGNALVQALAQIVYTAAEIDGIQSVEITVEGDRQAWPTGDLDATDEPLTVYDFPGLVRSAQPAYPSVPSGG
jgi:Sporulation and spore germination